MRKLLLAMLAGLALSVAGSVATPHARALVNDVRLTVTRPAPGYLRLSWTDRGPHIMGLTLYFVYEVADPKEGVGQLVYYTQDQTCLLAEVSWPQYYRVVKKEFSNE